jgi:hypothetical protein
MTACNEPFYRVLPGKAANPIYGHKDEVCFKRERERMAKKWANKDKYLMVYLSLVCHCLGQRSLCIRFQLGEIGKLQVVLMAEHHRSDR